MRLARATARATTLRALVGDLSRTCPSWGRTFSSACAPGEGANAADGSADGSVDGSDPAVSAARARGRMRDSARRAREGAEATEGGLASWGWLYDLTETGETVDRWTNGVNARLSDRAKTQMYAMHCEDPVTWTVDALASKYRVRKQRIGAILALKKREEAAVRENETLYHEVEAAMERVTGSVDVGAGERHVYDAPTMPQFQTVSAFEHGRSAKPKRFIEAAELAKQQERVLVREFFERLDFNMGEIAPGLRRVRGKGRAPPRPAGGYALHVTPLGDSTLDPYVAYRDGTQRPLNDDERELARQQTPRRRRRLL